MLGRTALTTARAIRTALGAGDLINARSILGAYDGSSRLPITALVHGVVRAQRPMVAAVAVESFIERSCTLRVPTLQAYISSLSSVQPPFLDHNETQHTPTSAALTILAAARRSRKQQRTSHMYDAAIRACLLQGEILTGSLLFVLLVRDWQNRKRVRQESPPEPVPAPVMPLLKNPLKQWKRSFPSAFTSPIPHEAPPPPFPAPHLLEAVVASLDLRPRKHPQASHSLPPGRPPDSVLALSHLTRLFFEGKLPFGRVAALLKAIASVPPCPHQSYFRSVLRRTMYHPPLLDTRAYNMLINHALSVFLNPDLAKRLIDHMSTAREPPLRITDTTRAIVARGEAKLRQPGLSIRLLSHIDARGHSTRLPTNDQRPVPDPFLSVSQFLKLPKDPHVLAAYIHNLTSTGEPEHVLSIVYTLIPELDLPPPPSRASFVSATKKAVSLGTSVLTSLLNGLCKAGKTGLAERVWRLGCAAQALSPETFALPLAFHTAMMQLYAREARKGLVVVSPEPLQARIHSARAIVDVSVVRDPPPTSATAYGWGFATPLPPIPGLSPESVGRMDSRIRRWLLARHSAAEIYTNYIRQSLPLSSNPDSAMLHAPDARLWNALFDTFGRRANMLVHTYRSYVDRHRASRISIIGPKQVDAFMRIVVQDMCETGMGADVPSGWRHLVPSEWTWCLPPLPPPYPGHISNRRKQKRWWKNGGREKRGENILGRWRVRETRLRYRFGKLASRANVWAVKSVHSTWPRALSRAERKGVVLGRQHRVRTLGRL